MNSSASTPKTEYKKKLFWRKVRLYLVWGASFIACLILSFNLLDARFTKMITPQINRAFMQIANLLPDLSENEVTLAKIFDAMTENRNNAVKADIGLSEADLDSSTSLDALISSCFSLDRITRIKVGHDGNVIVVKKDDGSIIAHPDQQFIGSKLMVSSIKERSDGSIDSSSIRGMNIAECGGLSGISLETFRTNQMAELFKLNHHFVYPRNLDTRNDDAVLNNLMYASIVPYEDYYIVCGVKGIEYIRYMSQSLVISLLACVMLWVFVYYICLLLNRHEESLSVLRTRLCSYSLIIVVVIFGVSWYIQVLNDITNDLKTMTIHGNAAVDTLNVYRSSQKKINDWLDEQYLFQCRVASKYVRSLEPDKLTRQYLEQLSQELGVKHIYVFDQSGTVRVTNSPYDHLSVSDNDEDPTHVFHRLLEGVDHVVLDPMPDVVSGQRLQYIGVSVRNEQDLADGFVLVTIDPYLRDQLIKPLNVQSVLENLIIGLPEHAIAIDKKSLNISATTGIGYVGQAASEVGITSEKLQPSYSGFLEHDGKTYYAGFSEAEDLYIVPVVVRTSNENSFFISLGIAGIELVALLLIIFLALHNYQSEVVDAAPPEEAPEASSGIKISIPFLPQFKEKKGFERRWAAYIPNARQTPSTRIKAIIFDLLLIFCVLNLLPTMWYKLRDASDISSLSGISYVMAGRWEKGFNIFALSSCVFLLFVLYVFNMVSSRLLYTIAKSTDMRGETICLLLRSSLKYVSFIVFAYYGLSKFGIPTQALLASAGILTLAVSMGAKDLVNDIIAGFFILMEGNIQVGDRVTVGSWKGTVEEIGIRTTRIINAYQTKFFNNSNLRDVVSTNGEPETTSMTLSLAVNVNASLEKIEALIEKELPKTAEFIPGLVNPPQYEGVENIQDGCMILRFTILASSGESSKAFRELNRQVKLMFERNGIEIPAK